MPNLVKILGYIKCYSFSSPRPVKSPGNSIRYNCQKICSRLRRPKTLLEIKRVTFLQMINNRIIYKFLKDFTNHRKKTNMAMVFSCRPFPNIFKCRDHGWDFPTIWKTSFLQTHNEDFSYYVSKSRLTIP